jgi:hypothetical protein
MRTLISDMDLTSYTHIHMSFATLNSDLTFNIGTIKDQMARFASLSGVKRIISVGGWGFSTDPDTYSIFRDAVSTSANRAALVSATIASLNEWNLDGADWEYPGEPDIPGIPADDTDRGSAFFLFLLELSTAMEVQTPEKTLSTTAPSHEHRGLHIQCGTGRHCSGRGGLYVIDEKSNSNIMVWNQTQWAAYMDDDIKATRAQLYQGLNFLGTADWAVDLQTSNDITGDDTTSACEIWIDPSVWTEESPSVLLTHLASLAIGYYDHHHLPLMAHSRHL